MKRTKIVGYGVTAWLEHGLMGLAEDGLLYHMSAGTVFKERKDARNALRRTKAYVKRTPQCSWKLENCSIQTLREVQL